MAMTDSAAWARGIVRAREAVEQGLVDLEKQLAYLEQDPSATEADVGFARYAIERYREVLA